MPDARPLNRPLMPGLAGRLPSSELSLLDLADRLLNRGVVVAGEATISVAGIDLIYLGLNLVLASVETLRASPAPRGPERGMGRWGDQEGGRPAAPESGAVTMPPPIASSLPSHPSKAILELDPDHMEEGLARLVLTLVELIRQLLERQAIRRMDGGGLSEAEVERLGLALMRLQEKLYEMAATFGLQPDDLNINLGPLGNLL